MDKNDKKVKAIDEAIEKAKEKYAADCGAICNSKGYDENDPVWQQKIKAAADKFAKRFLDLLAIKEELTGVADEDNDDPRKWFVGRK